MPNDRALLDGVAKLTNCCVAVIVSLLRRTYESLHAKSLQELSRTLHLALFA